jgi:hypothetical protein
LPAAKSEYTGSLVTLRKITYLHAFLLEFGISVEELPLLPGVPFEIMFASLPQPAI